MPLSVFYYIPCFRLGQLDGFHRHYQSGCASKRWLVQNKERGIWNGQVETEVLSRFNRTAMLTYDPGRSGPDGPLQPYGANASCIGTFTVR